MDIEKVIQFSQRHLSLQVHIFVSTLIRPWSPDISLLPVPRAREIVLNQNIQARLLSPDLWIYVAVCVLAGGTINKQLFQEESSSTIERLVVLSIMWLFFTAVVHNISRVLGTRTKYYDTVAHALPSIATCYVIANLFSLIMKGIRPLIPALSEWSLGEAYILVLSGMVAIYTPLSLKVLHQLNIWKLIVITVLSPIIFAIPFILFANIGVYYHH